MQGRSRQCSSAPPREGWIDPSLGMTELPKEQWQGAHGVVDPGRTTPEPSGVWAVVPPHRAPRASGLAGS